MATIEEQIAEKHRREAESKRNYQRRRVAALKAQGLCVQCQRKHDGSANRCAICSATEVGENWRRYQRRPVTQAQKSAASWNLETDSLIAEHVVLAKKLAWCAYNRVHNSTSTVDVDDMVGDAMYGLVLAGRTFNPARDVPFQAWAIKKIKGEIYNGFSRWVHGRQKQPPTFVPLDVDE